jgi:RHS repeat-associated protein
MTGLEPTAASAPPLPLRVAAASQTPHVFCIEWNPENQLTRVTKNSVEQARFKYDPRGRRVEKAAGGVTTTYTLDRVNIVREVSGTTTLKYIHGRGIDEPLATDDGSALSYYHADGLGSAVRTTSPSGSVSLTRQFDAWGKLQAGGTSAGYGFTGREWDPQTSLHYYRARYYDPEVGRFLSEDPIPATSRRREEHNSYAYVANRPITAVDPSGLQIYVCSRWVQSPWWLGAAGGRHVYIWSSCNQRASGQGNQYGNNQEQPAADFCVPVGPDDCSADWQALQCCAQNVAVPHSTLTHDCHTTVDLALKCSNLPPAEHSWWWPPWVRLYGK